jgi:16S rRNA processing protein RimM
MTLSDTFELGYILRPHGLKGDVILVLDSDDPQAYEAVEVLYLQLRQGLVPYRVEGFNLQKQGEQAIVKLKGLTRVEDAEELKGVKIYLPLAELPALEEDQFFYHDIVGYEVADAAQGNAIIGTITEVYELPQQVMLGVLVQGVEALIPLHDDFLVETDKANKRLVMSLPEGLLDLYLGGEDSF